MLPMGSRAFGFEPVDPFQRRELDGLEATPWPASVDHLGLVKAVDSFGESIVIGISDAADRGLHACAFRGIVSTDFSAS